MTVITNVNTDPGEGSLKSRVTEITGFEVILFPETWLSMRYVVFAILAQVLAVGVDHRRGVVVHTGDLFLIDRHYHNHAVLASDLLHQLDGRPVWNFLDRFVPARLLLGAEVRSRKDLLHANDLNPTRRCLLDEGDVLHYVFV